MAAKKKSDAPVDVTLAEDASDPQDTQPDLAAEIGTGGELDRALAEVATLKKENEELKARLNSMATAALVAEDGVVWGGRRCRILYAGETRQLWEDFKRRQVEDGWMALVIDYPAA